MAAVTVGQTETETATLEAETATVGADTADMQGRWTKAAKVVVKNVAGRRAQTRLRCPCGRYAISQVVP